MEEYLIPTRTAQAEFVEKRSTFIGHVWPVDSEEQEEYAVQVTLRALLPEGQAEAFSMRMTELSAGAFGAVELGQVLRPAPLEGR